MSWTVAAVAASVLVARAAADAVPPLPEPTEIGTTGYCVIEGEWEYAPRWNFPDNSVSTMTLEECAIACGEHELCTGATFLDYPDNTDKKNCWMKSWESPPAPAGTPCYGGEKPAFVYNAIILQNAATCAETTFVADPVDCGTDSTAYEEGESAVLTPKTVGAVAAGPAAAVPAAAGPVPTMDVPADAVMPIATAASEYVGYKGYDYIPGDVAAPAVSVVDVGGGSTVADELACAEECDATAGCNAGSYYGAKPEADWPAGKNCWLKTIGVSCSLPADAMADAGAMLIMKVTGETCPPDFGTPGAAAGPAGVTEAAGPGEVTPLATAPLPDGAVTVEGPPTTTDEATVRNFEAEVATTPTEVPVPDVSGAAGSAAAAAAVATLAAGAALLI